MQGSVAPDSNVGGRNLVNPLIDRVRTRNVFECKIIGEGFQVDGPLEARNCEQALDFTAEIQRILLLDIIKGFDSDSIPPEQEFLLTVIPNCESKHPSKMGDQVLTILLIQMDQA